VNDNERLLLSLPGCCGGFAIDNPMLSAADQHMSSKRSAAYLTEQLVSQCLSLKLHTDTQREIKIAIRKEQAMKVQRVCKDLEDILPSHQQRAMRAAQERGASALVTTLPIKRLGFSLTKFEFQDQLLMRYRWPLKDLPSTCACGSPFSVDHSQICHLGGFINMRHNELRDLMASEMRHFLKDVEVEPCLTPLSGESLRPRSAITSDDARADIRARSFWQRQRNAFFDIRVFYPHASSYLDKSLPSLYDSMEKRKKREYEDRILQIENGSFTPLIFSSTGGMGRQASIALKHLATCASESKREPYSQIMRALRCRIAFSLMRSSSICLRGTRHKSNSANYQTDLPAELVIQEAMIRYS
jgi:hypothetical protein